MLEHGAVISLSYSEQYSVYCPAAFYNHIFSNFLTAPHKCHSFLLDMCLPTMFLFSTCNNDANKEAPCVGNSRAKYLSQEERDSLTELCPSYQPGLLGCCDEKSVNVMKSLLSLASSVSSESS